MLALFIAIQVALSVCVIMRLVKMAHAMRFNWLRKLTHKLFSSVLFFLAVNLLISVFIAAFTGAGAYAGMANIASSVLISVFGRRGYKAYSQYLESQYTQTKQDYIVLHGV